MNVALELIGEGYRLAREISEDTKVCAVLVGQDIEHLVNECYAYGADQVYLIQDELLRNYTTDGYTKVITDAVKTYKPEIVVYGATHIGRDLAPRVAARLNTGLTADCTRLDVDINSYIKYAKDNTTLDVSTLDQGTAKAKAKRPAFWSDQDATNLCPRTSPGCLPSGPELCRKKNTILKPAVN